MRKAILITLPKSDDVTEYLSVFSGEIICEASKTSIKIKKIEKEKVTKKHFEKILKSFDCKMIIFNGHGSTHCILGHKDEELIKVGTNEKLLKERITYSRSCWSVAGVGKESMKNTKEGVFIGYKIPFMFLIDITWATNPIKDKIAKVFFDTSNRIPLSFIKGKNAEEAHENSKTSILKAINKALKKGDRDSQAIAETLWNNYVGQEILGNKNVRLV